MFVLTANNFRPKSHCFHKKLLPTEKKYLNEFFVLSNSMGIDNANAIIDEFATKEFWLYFILSRRQKWKILQYLNGIERGVGDTEAKSGFFQR